MSEETSRPVGILADVKNNDFKEKIQAGHQTKGFGDVKFAEVKIAILLVLVTRMIFLGVAFFPEGKSDKVLKSY